MISRVLEGSVEVGGLVSGESFLVRSLGSVSRRKYPLTDSEGKRSARTLVASMELVHFGNPALKCARLGSLT